MSRNNKSANRPILRALDVVVIVALLCGSVVSGLYLYGRSSAVPSAVFAEIEIGGKAVYTHLMKTGEPDSLVSLELPRGRGTVQIRGGRIRILPMPDSVCPLHICSRTGWIERPGQFIACVPNRLIITIRATEGSPSDTIDAVTY